MIEYPGGINTQPQKLNLFPRNEWRETIWLLKRVLSACKMIGKFGHPALKFSN
jgi:hypothetical protein